MRTASQWVIRGTGQTTHHHPDRCQSDPSFRSVRIIGVITHHLPMEGQPGQRAFHDPAAGQHRESLLSRRTLDDRHRCRIAVRVQPGRQVAPIGRVSPDCAQRDAPATPVGQQSLGSVAIIAIGRMHHAPPQHAHRVHQPMPRASGTVVATVGAAFRATHPRRVDALGIETSRTGVRMAPFPLDAHEATQRLPHHRADATSVPAMNRTTHRLMGRNVLGQHAPLSQCAVCTRWHCASRAGQRDGVGRIPSGAGSPTDEPAATRHRSYRWHSPGVGRG